jgi:perosamine synthetase
LAALVQVRRDAAHIRAARLPFTMDSMTNIGPLPRLRLYTGLGHYTTLAGGLAGRFGADRGQIQALERRLCELTGARHAVTAPMARVAICLAIKHLIKPGQKVIVSPYTIADVINMVVCAGGVPVFADIERETCNIDAAEVERLIDDETGAVMVTHFYGLACDIKRIAAICAARKVPLIEDAAQAFGVRIDGRQVGTFGDAGIFSFGMYKNVNSFLGGAIVTPHAWLRDAVTAEMAGWPLQPVGDYLRKAVKALVVDTVTLPTVFRPFTFRLFRYAFLRNVEAINRHLKIDTDPEIKRALPESYKCRMSPLQAELVLRQLDDIDQKTRKRIEAAKVYHEGLRDLPELILPPLRDDFSHMYWYFPIQYERRHDLVKFAMQHGRDITESYHRNCAELPCFAEFARDCPKAHATAASLIYLPTYPRYGLDEVRRTVEVIRAYFNR